MKFILLVSILIGLSICGHIYVSDPQLHYQNTGYLTSAQLYFKLETDLYQNEVLKIVWPFTFNATTGLVKLSIHAITSTTPLSIGIATTDNTTKAYLVRVQAQLNAQQWYILNISSSVPQSPTVQSYTAPIQMSTHSGMASTGLITDYLMYDYNTACGFIAVAPAPDSLSSIVVSDSELGIVAPLNSDENQYLDASYPVYITILTSNDYEYGGTFYFKITDGFQWTGSCEALSQNCGDNTSCITVQALSAESDYICTVTDSLVTFKRYQNVSKLSINHQDYMRIRINVKNPSIVATGGVTVQLVSNFANYIYEVLNIASLFQTATIALGTDNALFLWGLPRDLAQNKGCPIRIYFTVHTGIAVWNKISLPFYPLITLPDSNQGFYIQVDVKAASIINDLSIYTDAGAFDSNAVTCASDASSTVEKYIFCRNVGKLLSNVTKYVKFAFIVDAADYEGPNEFATFGSITIYNSEYQLAVTGSVTPTNIFDSAKNNVMYTPDLQGNAVFDMEAGYAYGFTPAPTFFDVTARGDNIPAGRSSIKYTNAETNLFFPITTSFQTQCCDAYNPANFYDCPDLLNNECKTITIVGTYGATLILKMLANKNALSLSLTDQDSTVAAETNVFKGVELYPSIPGTPGMFGMDGLVNGISTNELLCLADKADPLTRICSTYSKYVNYYDAKSTTSTLYLYNQWFLTSDAWELHTVCWAGHAAPLKQVCGAAQNVNKGILMRHVTLTVVANTIYPQQTDLDFIMCLRYAEELTTTLGKDGTTKLATSSLINAQILNFVSTASEQVSTSGTMFKIGIINYFTQALDVGHIANYVPTLLRIGGYMQAAEVTANTGIAFFFDGDNIVITDSKLSTNMPLTPTECASSLVTGIVCRYFKARLVNSNTPTGGLHKDFYPGLNAITIGGAAITGSTEFNYYIPVQIKVPVFTFAFFGLINNYATFATVTSVYKIYGTVENAQTAANAWKSCAVAGAVAHTIATYWTVQSTIGPGATMLNGEGDWEIDGSTIGVLNTYSGSAVTKALHLDKLAYVSSSPVYPGDVATAAIIDASFDAGSTAAIDFFNDDSIMMVTPLKTHSASMHFMVNSQIKYWSGDITWSLTNITNPFSARCVDMAITSYYDTTHSPLQYLILCPYEGKLSTGNSIVSVFPTLTLASWAWPDYYGTDAYVGVHLRYMWTDRLGNLKAYLTEKKKGTARVACALGTGTAVFALQTSQKKAQISITPSNSIELLPATASLKEKEKMLINLIVTSSTSSELPTPKCSSGLSSVKCQVSKAASTFSFTLSNSDIVNAKTVPNQPVTLTFWLGSTAVTQETLTYSATIFAYFYKKHTLQENAIPSLINDCNSLAAWTSGPKEGDNVITVSDPNRDIMVIGARTSFSFSFSSSYTILDASKFTLNLAFLATANANLVSNLRCAIYSGNTISHLFDKFSYSTLTAVQFEYKQQDTTLDLVTEIGTVNYTFLCNGGEVIQTAPSSSSKIYVQNVLSSTIGEGYGNDQSTGYASLRNVSSSQNANVTLTKTFSQAGQDSTYTFNIKVAPKIETSEDNITTTTIRFKAGSKLYVELARDISPRFNKLGLIRCYHEGNPSQCQYEGERRISLTTITDLDHNQTDGHNLSIVGIQRPLEFGNYKKIYIALVPDQGTFNYLEFQDSVSVEDATTADEAVNTLPVVYYSQDSDNIIRSMFSLTMHIKFPASSISENIPIWVDFPEEFDEVMILGWSPSCQFNNVKISENDTLQNYVSSCELNSNRRVKFNIITDPNNTNTKLYALIISGIPTYTYEEQYLNAPVVWFGNSNSTTVPLYKTNLGYFNETYNLQTFTYSDMNTSTSSISNTYQEAPFINSPSVFSTDNSITFTWIGANNTDGFLFVGVIQETNKTVDPTALQLKSNSDYDFEAFNKTFYAQSISVSLTLSPTIKCQDYKYYWIATNQDTETYKYTTDIKSGTIRTTGCLTYANMLNYSIVFILLIFVILLAQSTE